MALRWVSLLPIVGAHPVLDAFMNNLTGVLHQITQAAKEQRKEYRLVEDWYKGEREGIENEEKTLIEEKKTQEQEKLQLTGQLTIAEREAATLQNELLRLEDKISELRQTRQAEAGGPPPIIPPTQFLNDINETDNLVTMMTEPDPTLTAAPTGHPPAMGNDAAAPPTMDPVMGSTDRPLHPTEVQPVEGERLDNLRDLKRLGDAVVRLANERRQKQDEIVELAAKIDQLQEALNYFDIRIEGNRSVWRTVKKRRDDIVDRMRENDGKRKAEFDTLENILQLLGTGEGAVVPSAPAVPVPPPEAGGVQPVPLPPIHMNADKDQDVTLIQIKEEPIFNVTGELKRLLNQLEEDHWQWCKAHTNHFKDMVSQAQTRADAANAARSEYEATEAQIHNEINELKQKQELDQQKLRKHNQEWNLAREKYEEEFHDVNDTKRKLNDIRLILKRLYQHILLTQIHPITRKRAEGLSFLQKLIDDTDDIDEVERERHEDEDEASNKTEESDEASAPDNDEHTDDDDVLLVSDGEKKARSILSSAARDLDFEEDNEEAREDGPFDALKRRVRNAANKIKNRIKSRKNKRKNRRKNRRRINRPPVPAPVPVPVPVPVAPPPPGAGGALPPPAQITPSSSTAIPPLDAVPAIPVAPETTLPPGGIDTARSPGTPGAIGATPAAPFPTAVGTTPSPVSPAAGATPTESTITPDTTLPPITTPPPLPPSLQSGMPPLPDAAVTPTTTLPPATTPMPIPTVPVVPPAPTTTPEPLPPPPPPPQTVLPPVPPPYKPVGKPLRVVVKKLLRRLGKERRIIRRKRGEGRHRFLDDRRKLLESKRVTKQQRMELKHHIQHSIQQLNEQKEATNSELRSSQRKMERFSKSCRYVLRKFGTGESGSAPMAPPQRPPNAVPRGRRSEGRDVPTQPHHPDVPDAPHHPPATPDAPHHPSAAPHHRPTNLPPPIDGDLPPPHAIDNPLPPTTPENVLEVIPAPVFPKMNVPHGFFMRREHTTPSGKVIVETMEERFVPIMLH